MIGSVGALLNSVRNPAGTGVPEWATWMLLAVLAGSIAVFVWVIIDYCKKWPRP